MGDLLAELEADPYTWLVTLFPRTITAPFAAHHVRFWDHIWSIRPGVRPAGYVAIWGRGGGKSSAAEIAVIALGATARRRYCLYVSESQDQADEHVGAIASHLESREIATFYPALATRRLGKYGSARGWRRNRLWTAGGLVVDAVGLGAAARGRKMVDEIGSTRPDMLVLDDVDDELDTANDVDRKVRVLTKRLLPTGTGDLAVIGVQNLVHNDSVFARIANRTSGLLADAIVDGPIPAVYDLQVTHENGRYRVVGGTPSWAGQDLDVVQTQIDSWTYSAFMSEAQHETEPNPGGMFDHLDFEAITVTDIPEMVRTACWCDPAVTSTDRSDAHGVVVDGVGTDGRLYGLFSWEQRATPITTLTVAIARAVEWGCQYVGVETDQGGDTWLSVFSEAKRMVADRALEDGDPELARRVARLDFRQQKAGSTQMSKAARAQRTLLPAYERDQVRHLAGTHMVRQRALRRFPLSKPLDLVDACVWSARDLIEYGPASVSVSNPARRSWR